MSSGMTPRPLQGRHSFVLSRTMRPPVVTVSTYPRPPHSWHGDLTETVSSTEECSPPSIAQENLPPAHQSCPRGGRQNWPCSQSTIPFASIVGCLGALDHASRRNTASSAGNRWPQGQPTG